MLFIVYAHHGLLKLLTKQNIRHSIEFGFEAFILKTLRVSDKTRMWVSLTSTYYCVEIIAVN